MPESVTEGWWGLFHKTGRGSEFRVSGSEVVNCNIVYPFNCCLPAYRQPTATASCFR